MIKFLLYVRKMFKSTVQFICLIYKLIFYRKKRIFLLDPPIHPNLGDQAQLMCTYQWLAREYPMYSVIEIPIMRSTLNFTSFFRMLIDAIYALLTTSLLKLFVRKNDLMIGHSGYFFVDHHNGWKLFDDMLTLFPENKMIILPQTINFYTPYIKEYVSRRFANKENLILLCRDEKSFDNASYLFPNTKLLLYPDIVTSLIGYYNNNSNNRDGVLFCIRNDVEAFYDSSRVKKLFDLFGNIRKEMIDTTLDSSLSDVLKNKEKYIYEIIYKISTYSVVITDRYHGTIFSAIASTPVIVITSADHKLSSGVKWFDKANMSSNVLFATDLDDAFIKAKYIIDNNVRVVPNTYFFDNYWGKLKGHIDKLWN